MIPTVNTNLQALQQMGSKPVMPSVAPAAIPTIPVHAAKHMINPEVQKKIESNPRFKEVSASIKAGPQGLIDAMKKFHADKKTKTKTKE